MNETLTFDEATHTYTLNGEKLPSVTRLLKDAGLVDDRWFNEQGARRGSFAHSALEFYDHNDLDESTLDPRLLGFLEGWKKFKAESQIEILSIEERVCNEAYWYAGTLDRRVMMQGEEIIIDVKTGAPMAHHGCQLALYRMCFPRPLGGMGVYLSEGGYKIIEYGQLEHMATARAIVTLAAWKRKYGRREA